MAKRKAMRYEDLIGHSMIALEEATDYAKGLLRTARTFSDSVILTPEQRAELLEKASELEYRASRASRII